MAVWWPENPGIEGAKPSGVPGAELAGTSTAELGGTTEHPTPGPSPATGADTQGL